MNQANMELQRLLRLMSDAAHKIEKDAYISGWHDCRESMIKALNAVPATEGPLSTAAEHHGEQEHSFEHAAQS